MLNDVEDTTFEEGKNTSSEEYSPVPVDKKLTVSTLNPLNDAEQEIAQNIINASTKEELQVQFDLFNMNQSKKDALRIIRLNTIRDKVEDATYDRVTKRPDLLTGRELIEIMNTTTDQIERAQKGMEAIQNKQAITFKPTIENVNVNVAPKLNRDNEEHVVDAVTNIINQMNALQNQEPTEVIPADDVEEKSNESEDILNNENV